MKYLILILLLITTAANAQDTTYNTFQVQHDSVVTTTIPEQIICRDSLIEVLDTTYNAYFDNKLYAVVDGSIFTTVTLCDTIAAHDTTFTCTLCAVHDTTIMIISAHPVTIRANNQSKALGATFTFANNGTQLSITGGSLKAGDVITVDNSSSTGAPSGAASGVYAITLSSVTIMRGATDVTSTYSINYQNGTLTVAGAIPITIKADDQGKTAGQTFTFLNNGTQVDVTSGTLDAGDAITSDNAASAGAGSGAAAGTYPITLSSVTIMDGATNVTGNYAITYVAGTLTVAAAPQIITVKARNQTKQYGQTFTFTGNGSQVQIIAGGLQSGDVITADNAASTGAIPTAATGGYAITLSSITIMNGATNVTGNYTITYQSGTLTVTTIPITVKANNQTKTQGQTFTFTGNGTQVSVISGSLLSGNAITIDNAASTGAASGALTGSYPITLSSVTIMSGATNVTTNYSITYQGGTLAVSSPPNVNINYGIFPLTSQTYPTFQARLDHAHYVGVPVFRYNYDYGDQYKTDDVINDGLRCALTYNHRRNGMQSPNTNHDFPVGTAEINFFAGKLDSVLSLPDKPEIVSVCNEEGHREYWNGTVQQYLAFLEACVTVSHNHGIPISNGGITNPVVYSLRKWYVDRGLQDSVDFVDAAYDITGNAGGTYVQEMLAWYEPLLNGFAASNMDYVNLHWYEWPRTSGNASTIATSKLLPPLINFIQVRTGKPVITTETGTQNYQYALLYEMLDQWKASGARWIIYYAGGEKDRAVDNSEGYRSWLLQ